MLRCLIIITEKISAAKPLTSHRRNVSQAVRSGGLLRYTKQNGVYRSNGVWLLSGTTACKRQPTHSHQTTCKINVLALVVGHRCAVLSPTRTTVILLRGAWCEPQFQL